MSLSAVLMSSAAAGGLGTLANIPLTFGSKVLAIPYSISFPTAAFMGAISGPILFFTSKKIEKDGNYGNWLQYAYIGVVFSSVLKGASIAGFIQPASTAHILALSFFAAALFMRLSNSYEGK